MITYRELIANAKKKIELVDLENRAIYEFLMDILNCDRTKLILMEEENVSEEVLDKVSEMLADYIFDYKPIEYILGYTYFCGNKIYVNENTLIPRNETEEVVEEAIRVISDHEFSKVLDLASGSGAIALSVKNVLPNIEVIGSDISKGALDMARKNAKSLGLDVNFVESDVLDGFISNNVKFDMIISNPPYVSMDYVLPNKIIEHEPKLALYAKDNGLYYYRKILEDSKKVLNSKGAIVFEIGYDQGQALKDLANEILNDYTIEVKKDIANNDRIVVIKFNS
jgi:release factor glutamine methyltransferase